jgi:tRNA(Leu) C34 or U34 (ribose-2'-O)-methylase TrmL
MNITTTTTSNMVGKNTRVMGQVPGIVLVNPRFAFNVGMAVRLASCYGLSQLWFTGERVRLSIEQKGRLPREERMKGWRNVTMVNNDRPLDLFPSDAVPVAVEVRANSERLQNFVHPAKAVYMFGPEDGSIPQMFLAKCHRFVIIPTRKSFCLNLATALATILWDRALKLGEVPDEEGGEGGYEDTQPEEMGLFDTLKQLDRDSHGL